MRRVLLRGVLLGRLLRIGLGLGVLLRRLLVGRRCIWLLGRRGLRIGLGLRLVLRRLLSIWLLWIRRAQRESPRG